METVKAKKGNLAAFTRTSSYTSLQTGTHRRTYWAVGLVAQTDRTGIVKKVQQGNLTMPLPLGARILIASTIAKPVAEVIADALRLEEYETPEAARDAIKALLA